MSSVFGVNPVRRTRIVAPMPCAPGWRCRFADPRDDEDTRSGKALLVLISVLILPIALLGASLPWPFGSPVGFVPLVYFVVLLAERSASSRGSRDCPASPCEPDGHPVRATLSMIPLGGFLDSGGVGFLGHPRRRWGPGVRRRLEQRQMARRLRVIFVGSGIAGEVLGGITAGPAWFIEHDARAERGGRGHDRLHAVSAVRATAPRRPDALGAEQAKSENLLLNILPRSIAERLKAQTRPIADQFSSASILFADVVDFTPSTGRREPAEVVGILDQLCSHFDTLADRYGLEKIKTIGDCYMAAAGVPTPRPDHAQALALMALDMLERCAPATNRPVRAGTAVGINSGPVVAGVIGRKRFLYDLWGDAVNTASRMESHGTSGRIQITRATYELLGTSSNASRGARSLIKGKGEMEAWYLVGRQPSRAPVPLGSAATAGTGAAASDRRA